MIDNALMREVEKRKEDRESIFRLELENEALVYHATKVGKTGSQDMKRRNHLVTLAALALSMIQKIDRERNGPAVPEVDPNQIEFPFIPKDWRDVTWVHCANQGCTRPMRKGCVQCHYCSENAADLCSVGKRNKYE